MRYQFATLSHGHRLVNGISGFRSPLAALLEGVGSPFLRNEPFLDGIEALRRIGVRYVVVHLDEFVDGAGAGIVDALRTTPGLVRFHAYAGKAVLLELREPIETEPPKIDQRRGRITLLRPRGTSDNASALPLVFDNDPTTRWATGSAQNGSEWVEIQFDRSRDVAGLRITMGAFAEEYPRHLVVESLEEGRESSVLFEGSVLPHLVHGLVQAPLDAPIDIALPTNRSSALRLRQTGHALHRHWSIPEIALWKR